MSNPLRHESYRIALQFERIALRISAKLCPTHPDESRHLRKQATRMLRALRRSLKHESHELLRKEGINAGVWMVESLITLEELKAQGAALPLVFAAIEILERTENCMRAEGALPPALEA